MDVSPMPPMLLHILRLYAIIPVDGIICVEMDLLKRMQMSCVEKMKDPQHYLIQMSLTLTLLQASRY